MSVCHMAQLTWLHPAGSFSTAFAKSQFNSVKSFEDFQLTHMNAVVMRPTYWSDRALLVGYWPAHESCPYNPSALSCTSP